jgi:hypothetical protein
MKEEEEENLYYAPKIGDKITSDKFVAVVR